jgi:uncharacterized LabA/DUF88 family protein
MAKKKGLIESRTARAAQHPHLANSSVHVFVDDQNLFWGITNSEYGKDYRIDFGRLLLEACKDANGTTRSIASACIAGVIPDEDSFWEAAKNQGFQVRRGYLGTSNRSKQDDAYLITEIVSTVFEQIGPSTIVLIAGDADYMPPLKKTIEKGWRNEVAFIGHSISSALDSVVHSFREILPTSIQRYTNYPH